MSRSPFDDPRAGDVIRHPKFGGGCQFVVIKTMVRSGWGKAVQVELHPDDNRPMKPKRRVYGLPSWSEFGRDHSVSVIHLAKEQP